MNQSIRDKLEHLTGRLYELDRMLASGEATRDMDEYRKLSREHAELGPVVSLYQAWRQLRSDLCAGLDMLADPEMRELAEAEVAGARERLPEIEAELQKLLLPKDAKDDRNVFLEIRAKARPDIFIVYLGEAARDHSFLVARELRSAGISVALEFEERKMKKAMGQANKSRARFALIIGDDEVASGQYGLKNLETGEQNSLDLASIKSLLVGSQDIARQVAG